MAEPVEITVWDDESDGSRKHALHGDVAASMGMGTFGLSG